MMPQRIQRKRMKGWRMPEGAVYVGRGTKWGNPYPVGGRKEGALTIGPVTPQQCVSAYRALVWDIPPWDDLPFDELRGKDLACWCPLDQPCHADVLLELANGAQA